MTDTPSSERRLRVDGLCDRIRRAEIPSGLATRIVGIDGLGGSGKTTLATRLSQRLGANTLHTDYFASWQHPFDWYPRLIVEALSPLAAGDNARFQCTDWESGLLGPWVHLSSTPIIVLEGVSATRRALRPLLAYRIWIDAARDVRVARGMERDGAEMRRRWEAWMRAEDRYMSSERPDLFCDVVIAGDPHIAYDEEQEVVVRNTSTA
jgi:uridine kinase